MFEFQWNALRVGDRVAVHDDVDDGFGLGEGVVHMVETRMNAANDVAIRLDSGTTVIQRPRRHAVHMLPLNGRPPCWRCEASAAQRTDSAQPGLIVAA